MSLKNAPPYFSALSSGHAAGWPNRDLNPGAIIALSPVLEAARSSEGAVSCAVLRCPPSVPDREAARSC